MKKIVDNYEVKIQVSQERQRSHGDSASPKGMIFHAVDNSQSVKVLDIGFGLGTLGALIKLREESSHWIVDGVDGDMANCHNLELFEKKIFSQYLAWNGSRVA